mmetsp:Transcript_72389/g.125504  ORF Transcript_72389/g.125504 Transcript_72389/m.125504 type:complete len:168 (+) Transcript_72389:94-597(+)
MWATSFGQADPFLSDRYRLLNYFPRQPEQLQLEPDRMVSGCAAHASIGALGGSVMGLLMGGFFHTMQPMQVDTTASTWEQIRQSYRGFGQACTRMSRNFGKVGCVYAGVDCLFERQRGVKDVPNAIYAGCAAGAILAFQGGPGGMAFGCAGFAAFSAVIETLMGHNH